MVGDSSCLPLLIEAWSLLDDFRKLDSVVEAFLTSREDLFSSLMISSLCFTSFVLLGLRGVSADELGRSSDELAFD